MAVLPIDCAESDLTARKRVTAVAALAIYNRTIDDFIARRALRRTKCRAEKI